MYSTIEELAEQVTRLEEVTGTLLAALVVALDDSPKPDEVKRMTDEVTNLQRFYPEA